MNNNVNMTNNINNIENQLSALGLNSPMTAHNQVRRSTSDDIPSEGIRNAIPDRDHILPLIDTFLPVVLKVKHQFNIAGSIDDLWLHLNYKILKDVPSNVLSSIAPQCINEYLYTCLDNNLNPLKTEIASYFDEKSKTIKTQILLEGYIKIYATNPQSDGLEYVMHDRVTKEFKETTWVWDQNARRKVPHDTMVTKEIPSMVECKIYRKDMAHPTIGYAFIDDIGKTGAWTGHPCQMMCNRAFTRAVRMAYNLEGTSSEDVAELKSSSYEYHEQEQGQSAVEIANIQAKAVTTIMQSIDNCGNLEQLNSLMEKIKPALSQLPQSYQSQIALKVADRTTKFTPENAPKRRRKSATAETAQAPQPAQVSQTEQSAPAAAPSANPQVNMQNGFNQGAMQSNQQQLNPFDGQMMPNDFGAVNTGIGSASPEALQGIAQANASMQTVDSLDINQF